METREILLKADKVTVTFERLADGKIRVTTSSWDDAVVIWPSQVLEVAVIAIPDELWGEVPKAFVTLKPGAQLTEEELIAFCRERLARFKCPKAITFGELPKTSTGKIQKFKLRDQELAGQEKRIH